MNKISPRARLGKNVSIGDFTVVHDNVVIGDNSVIESHCVIGRPCSAAKGKPLKLGAGAKIGSHSVLYEGSSFGPGLMTGHGVLIREKTSGGAGLKIGSQTDIEGTCAIGDYVFMHSAVHVSMFSKIGSFVYLFPRVQFTNDPFPPSTAFVEGIVIDDMAVVCAQSLIMPGVRIGLGSFVAAGSVVREKVADVHCVAGSPATVFCRLDQFCHPRYGPYHPWTNRFLSKYPKQALPLIKKIVRRIDAKLR